MNKRKRAKRSIPTEEIPPIPYSIFDLDPTLQFDPETGKVRCVVAGCEKYLTPPARKQKGESCPEHLIRVHRSGTYSYVDPRFNAIVGRDLLADKVIGHPFKFESHRLGSERSEDMLTWNVFRSFQESGYLHLIGNYITGLETTEEPRLFLWGLEMTDLVEPWDLLIAARETFEKKLPVARPKTEFDSALFSQGHYLILIEAKFCSPNTFYENGPRKDKQSLTKEELLNLYWTLTTRMLDREKALEAERVYYQLWRNTIFAEHMSSLVEEGTTPYFANLTLKRCENSSFNHFLDMVTPECKHQVSHVFWEDLFVLAGLTGGKLDLLREYMLTKTAQLQPAFDFGIW